MVSIRAGGPSGASLMLDAILSDAIRRGASDVHLVNNAPVVYRVAGDLVPGTGDPLLSQQIIDLISPTLSTTQSELFYKNLHLSFVHRVTGFGNFRISLFFERGSVGAAIRLIPPALPAWETLGLPPQVDDWSRLSSGLLLVTGATGAGKTMTLNVIIDLINRTRRAKVVTVEDPIEYVHRHDRSLIVQKEVGADTSGFSDALFQALREDPDVIVIGEMRDLPTIATALTAAETGHLVMGTLHTRTAASSVERILDVFPSTQQPQIRAQLSLSLVAVVSQLLLPRVDGTGRILAYETMLTTSGVRAKIRDGNSKGLPDEITTGAKYGMRSMDESLRDLYENARITYEVAVNHASSKEAILRNA